VFRRIAGGALLLLVTGSLPACVKMKNGTVVNPDGSGRIVLRIGMKEDTVKMFESLAKKAAEEGELEDGSPAGLLDMDPDDLRRQFTGIAAFSVPEKSVADGWVLYTVTGWFEDVNQVTMRSQSEDEEEGDDGDDDGAGEPEEDAAGTAELEIRPKQDDTLRFSWKAEGEGFVLETKGGPVADMDELVEQLDPTGKNEEELATMKMSRGILKGMLEGLEMEHSVTLPGKVTTATGTTSTSERTATISCAMDQLLTDESAKTHAPKIRKALSEPFRIVCGKSETTPAELATFRKEFAAAKESWTKRVAEWDAAKAKPKTAAPGTPEAPGTPGAAPGGK
jgi:hypothetical protein